LKETQLGQKQAIYTITTVASVMCYSLTQYRLIYVKGWHP